MNDTFVGFNIAQGASVVADSVGNMQMENEKEEAAIINMYTSERAISVRIYLSRTNAPLCKIFRCLGPRNNQHQKERITSHNRYKKSVRCFVYKDWTTSELKWIVPSFLSKYDRLMLMPRITKCKIGLQHLLNTPTLHNNSPNLSMRYVTKCLTCMIIRFRMLNDWCCLA